MLSLKNRQGAVKAEIPKALYMAIVKLQAAEELDWEDACLKAAQLLHSNSVEFKRVVQLEAQRLYKQRFMRELNKARKTLMEQYHDIGFEEAMEIDHFRVPCSICGKPMHFSSRDQNWDEERRVLYEAFKNWHHTSCAKH
jgi:hypothetical protein